MLRRRRSQTYNSAVTKPSKAVAVFLVLFGMVFLAVGVFFGWAPLFAPPGSVHGSRAVGVVASAIFVVVGGGLTAGAIYGTRKLEEQAALEQSSPDSPWLWRKDWAAGRAYGNNTKKAIGLAVFAGLWNLISITVAAGALPQFFRTSDPRYLGPLLFVADGHSVAQNPVLVGLR